MIRICFAVLAALILAGCSAKEGLIAVKKSAEQSSRNLSAKSIPFIDMPADFGIEKVEGKREIDTVVVHTAYSLEGEPYNPQNLYNVFKRYNVSPHYMIDRNGTIYRLANENDLAHHAGKSKMADGREGVNRFSIGVELINSTIDIPTNAQYDSLSKLITDIKARLFAEIEFPNGVSDSDIGKMTRLSKYMIGETNALGFRSGKKIYPYPEYRIFEIVGIKSVKRGREFLQRMLQHRIMKKKEIDGSNYYVINPAYFMVSGKRLTLSLFLEFQQEIAPLLPGHVLAWFLNQAKEDKLLAVVKK